MFDLRFDLRHQLEYLREQVAPRSILPEGSVESTPLGSHYLIRATYAHDYFHG